MYKKTPSDGGVFFMLFRQINVVNFGLLRSDHACV